MGINEIIRYALPLYEDMINDSFGRQQMNHILDMINDKFDEHLHTRGRQANAVESMVEDLYFSEFNRIKNQLQVRLEDNLALQTKVLFSKVENDSKDAENYLEYYEDGLNQRINQNPFEGLNEEFIHNFTNRLMYRLESLGNTVEEIVNYDLMPDIKHQLNRMTEQIIEDLNDNIKRQNKRIINKAQEEVQKEIEQKQQEEENQDVIIDAQLVERFKNFATLFGYDLTVDNEKVILGNKEFNNQFELKSTNNGFLSFSDNTKAGILVEKGKIVFYDPRNNIKVTYDGNMNIAMESTISDRKDGEIRMNNGQLEILFNDELLTDAEQQSYVINYIGKKYPNLYDKLSSDKEISETFQRIKTESDEKDLYIDDGGKLKLNPKTAEEFKKRMYIVGYEVEEENGEYFAIDSKTGNKDKFIITKYGGISLENNQDVSLLPDYRIIHKKIVTKCMESKKPETGKVLANSKFNHFIISDHKKGYSITVRITEDGVKYESDTLNESQMIEKISSDLPNLMEYINSNKKWNEFSIPKKELEDEASLDNNSEEMTISDKELETKLPSLDENSEERSKFKSINQDNEEPKKMTEEEYKAKIEELEKQVAMLMAQNQSLREQIEKNNSLGVASIL